MTAMPTPPPHRHTENSPVDGRLVAPGRSGSPDRWAMALAAVLLAASLPVAAAAQPRLEPSAAQKLRSGPMLGYAELTETAVWLQTTVPARAQLRYFEQGRPETARLSATVATDPAADLIARFVLSDLSFGTRYEYELYLDGERVALPYPTTFQTQPMWRWRTDPPAFRIALGSCLYVNDPPFDRPGVPYGSEESILAVLAAQQPDLMLWLGDNVYYREADWLTEAAMRRRWADSRALPELQPLLASTHNYATWDDHDYGPNNSDRTFRGREAALRVFGDYWLNPAAGTPETPGVFHRFEWGDVELFLLDDRYHRSPNDLAADTPGKTHWGPGQLAWLLESLRSSQATFKLVVNGGRVLTPRGRYETVGNYPNDQRVLLDFLAAERIPGVVFVTGDIHFADLLRLDRGPLYPLYELTTSPLTAGPTDPARVEELSLRVPGTLVAGEHNFALIDVQGPRDQRLLVLRLLDARGNERWRQELAAADLRQGTPLAAPVAPAEPIAIEDLTVEEPLPEGGPEPTETGAPIGPPGG